jgi:excisionase family DNA binding protein
MQKLMLVEMPVGDLQQLIIDCVNTCLKHHKPGNTTDTRTAPAIEGQLLTKKEAANLLKVSTSTIDGYARAGVLERVKIGTGHGGVRFRQADVLAIVSPQKKG